MAMHQLNGYKMLNFAGASKWPKLELPLLLSNDPAPILPCNVKRSVALQKVIKKKNADATLYTAIDASTY